MNWDGGRRRRPYRATAMGRMRFEGLLDHHKQGELGQAEAAEDAGHLGTDIPPLAQCGLQRTGCSPRPQHRARRDRLAWQTDISGGNRRQMLRPCDVALSRRSETGQTTATNSDRSCTATHPHGPRCRGRRVRLISARIALHPSHQEGSGRYQLAPETDRPMIDEDCADHRNYRPGRRLSCSVPVG